MDTNDINIKKHIWISIILFIFLVIIKLFLDKIIIPYGLKDVSIGSIFSLFYGIYLIIISSLYFKKTFNYLEDGLEWKKELLKSYALLLLFFLLIGWSGTFVNWISRIGSPSPFPFFYALFPFFWEFYLFVPISIIFPVSLYTFYLAIKSFALAKKSGRGYTFGIILIILSVISLIFSLIPTYYILIFWIKGGVPAPW